MKRRPFKIFFSCLKIVRKCTLTIRYEGTKLRLTKVKIRFHAVSLIGTH